MKQSVLIVEDDRWQSDIYRDMLQTEFKLTICHDAHEALDALDKEIPAGIILDMMLPGGNGAALLQELRSYEDALDVPVVICSGVHMPAVQQEALMQFAPVTYVDKAELTPALLRKLVKESIHARSE